MKRWGASRKKIDFLSISKYIKTNHYKSLSNLSNHINRNPKFANTSEEDEESPE